jgi:hypothetical protein
LRERERERTNLATGGCEALVPILKLHWLGRNGAATALPYVKIPQKKIPFFELQVGEVIHMIDVS